MQPLLVLLSMLAMACSTAPYLGPLPGEEDSPDPGPLDAGSRDAAPDSAPGWVGPNPFPDAGVDAGSFPPDGAPSADFPYACDVYDVAFNCPWDEQLTPFAPCAPSLRGEVCPSLPGGGQVDFFMCAPAPGGQAVSRWTPHGRSVCGHDCEQLPSNSFFSLPTQDCARRPVQACDDGQSATSQESVDALLERVLRGCGYGGSAHGSAAGVTIESGCPSWFFSSLPRVPAPQLECLERELGRLRFDCDVPCARTVDILF